MSKPSPRPGTPHNPAPAKQRAQKRGRRAEWLVRLYLLATGHRILAANYKTPVGEIDLIARRGQTISFVEVKARPDQVDAADAVSSNQRRRIERAAEAFLMQTPERQRTDIRFDVALVTGVLRLRYLRDAWRPSVS